MIDAYIKIVIFLDCIFEGNFLNLKSYSYSPHFGMKYTYHQITFSNIVSLTRCIFHLGNSVDSKKNCQNNLIKKLACGCLDSINLLRKVLCSSETIIRDHLSGLTLIVRHVYSAIQSILGSLCSVGTSILTD